MIYPSTSGKPDETFRLRTLESVWIQGKLRMWGRWSHIGGGLVVICLMRFSLRKSE